MDTDKSIETIKRTFVVDTAFFIQLKAPERNSIYYTTKLVIDEIRDERAREHYSLNKDFFIIKNPTKDSMKSIIDFAKKSNDLFNLSIPDLSILALGYELSNINKTLSLRQNPSEWIIKKRAKKIKEEAEVDEEGFTVVKSKYKEEIEDTEDLWKDFEGNGEWINENNLESQISKFNKVEDVLIGDKEGVFIITDDFTIQNVCLKIGLQVISVNGLIIRRVKNYLFKCLTCNKFNFDTTVLFCQECGYPTLMKIGFSVNHNGEGIIYDKDPDIRIRGTQYDIPKPTLGKKSTVYILCEDQLPKKRDFCLEKNLDKILDNYEQYKDLIKNSQKMFVDGQSSKQYEWGYPKKNPNIPKKYYGKKSKK